MNYRDVINEIINLPWEVVNPKDLILISHSTAKEFAESLRLGLEIYPNDERLKEMADGELETTNMQYEDYLGPGDHWEFLDYFIKKYGIETSNNSIGPAINSYTTKVTSLSNLNRAMTIFSREEELASIFEKIISSHPWEKLGFGFYKYYLSQHVLFDKGNEGHAYLTKHFPLSDDVLTEFYKIRLELYSSLFKSL